MSLLQDLTVQQIVTRIFAMLIYAAVQGALLAGLARGLGDVRPAREGRLTLNPFLQASAWGVAMGVLFRMGWIAPLRLSPAQGFGERVRIVVIVAVGLGAMLVLVPLLDLLRAPLQQVLPRTAGYYVLYALQMVQELTFGSVALNLLPVPGLIAGNLWRAVWPGGERLLQRAEPLGLVLVGAALILGWVPLPFGWLDRLHLI